MRKLLVLVTLGVLLGSLFAAGNVQLQLTGQSVSWSQTLTFSVRQWIKVTWDYDETQTFAIDDATGESVIGNISFQSNKRFKMYYATPIIPNGVSVSALKVGSTTLSADQNNPTDVSSKLLSGQLSVVFSGLTPDQSDFQVKFEFTFMPF
uniref:Uncharacterized protein n=1 Tax=Fervidobacterium nodosum TaxID=2424 RepID=A0A7C5Y651_9BACT